jgi:TonB dependent receptor/Carboxypeptidase regulatory-like domain/TonB-dependent Receptor Plug Domain
MTILLRVKRGVVAALVVLAIVLQGTTSVLAGTTGSITGTVVDASTNRPVAGARVTALSPSQSATTTADAGGRFTFVSLSPDTYSLSVAATANHDAYALNGITVQADTTQTVTLPQPPLLQRIGSVTSRAASALVKPGATADVYSISATAQDKASSLGGGGTLNTAWSAMTSVPGVFVAANQTGYIGAGSTLSIRGGDYNQIGYELDGIPVNRSFDNYPSGAISSLGQQELQVYTGAAPANAESSGLSGYINQVIRTGTAPAYRSLDLGIGTPAFYNKLAFEVGGANPSRMFSYYVGLGGYNQDLRYADQFNGASLSQLWGAPLSDCGGVPSANYNAQTVPSCFDQRTGLEYTNNGVTPAYVFGPFNYGSQAETKDRDSIVNLHFGVPRKDGRDDVQLLYDNSHIGNLGYVSTNDAGGANYLNAIGEGAPFYIDSHQMQIPYGTVLPQTYAGGGAGLYLFPQSPTGRAMFAPIDPNARDQIVNDQSIVKLQYQRNFGTNAFFRLYGYTYYSDWLQTAPQAAYANYIAFAPNDYELNAHTRGVSALFSDQITDKHLLSVQGSYTTASSMRYNNSGIGYSNSTPVGYLVNGNDPYSGVCYTTSGTAVPGCNFAGKPGTAFGDFTLGQAVNGTVTPASGTCGTGPCQYVLVAGGPSATFNTVTPKFYSASVTDNWRASDRLSLNIGLRFDRFEFDGADTTNSGARTLFYNAYNIINPTAHFVNVPSQIEAYSEWQPRFGFTYTLNPATVVRGSYGRYAQAPNSAFEQYNYLQPNDVGSLVRFGNFGLPTTPGHPVRPEVSNNYDLSLEHQFGGDVAIKLTPFLRKTQDQIQQFFLDQKTNFVSGLNVGQQTSQGVELEIDKGDFARNGFAGKLSFTYTDSSIRYTSLPNGSTIIDPINAAISQYNSFTKGGGGSPCYSAGVGVPCSTTGAIANPYYNAPTQALLDPNGVYPTFDTFPGPPTVGYSAFGAPYVSTLILQYKHDRLAITPALQFSGGTRYGVPETTPGIDPTTCGAALSPTVLPGDARYNYGAAGGGAYDAGNCSATLVIPNQFTGRFDGIGAFVEPSQLALHLQTTYDVTNRVTLVANFSNLYTHCFGGTKVPFAIAGACGYTGQPGGAFTPVGNAYNPGNVIQPALQYPYYPVFGGFPLTGFPFNMFVEARIKI